MVKDTLGIILVIDRKINLIQKIIVKQNVCTFILIVFSYIFSLSYIIKVAFIFLTVSFLTLSAIKHYQIIKLQQALNVSHFAELYNLNTEGLIISLLLLNIVILKILI